MITRRGFVGRMAGLMAVGITGPRLLRQLSVSSLEPTPITVYKSSSCGCCAKWVDYLRASGFAPLVHDEEEMDAIKDKLGVPEPVRSCHTAQVQGYLIEGHVPASDIRQLLATKPKAAGLAVPGMPALAPGMAPPDAQSRDFDVVAFERNGDTRIFARY
jgi:hypothetical protein